LSTLKWTGYTNTNIAAFHPDGADAVYCNDRGQANIAMGVAFTHYVLHSGQEISGIIGLGGSGGTAMITPAMQALPIGVPKIMVSTMASGDVSAYVGGSDICMLYSVTDLAGLNRISRRVLANAANQMVGAVELDVPSADTDKPAVGLTMFGVTTPCVQNVIDKLSGQYDCIPFHATGNGGPAMEKLAVDGLLDGILDITTTEICDYLFGGSLACTATRLDEVAESGIPYVGSCGALDMINFGAPETVPEHYDARKFIYHNPQVTLMRTSALENVALANWIADKLNQCNGPVRFLVPLGGFSALDAPGGAFWDSEADDAFVETLRRRFIPGENRELILVPYHINSREFADRVVAEFRSIVK
jgi:uncharacterized protein (UPF0261 family)